MYKLITQGIMILFIILYSCAWVKKYPQDNFVEEVVEELIENELEKRYDIKADIDLTPFSKEQ